MHQPATWIFPAACIDADISLFFPLPFRTWPVNEQIIDLTHKAIYAFSTGYLIDRLLT